MVSDGGSLFDSVVVKGTICKLLYLYKTYCVACLPALLHLYVSLKKNCPEELNGRRSTSCEIKISAKLSFVTLTVVGENA